MLDAMWTREDLKRAFTLQRETRFKFWTIKRGTPHSDALRCTPMVAGPAGRVGGDGWGATEPVRFCSPSFQQRQSQSRWGDLAGKGTLLCMRTQGKLGQRQAIAPDRPDYSTVQ